MDEEKMAALTEEFPVKADKMRVLSKAGVSRGDIARFLGVRYQQVRNTLEGDKRTGYSPELEVTIRKKKIAAAEESPFRLIGAGGDKGAVLPHDLVKALVDEGEPLFAVATKDGLFISSAEGMHARVMASFQ